MLGAPLLQDGKKLVDRGAQKAMFATRCEDVGHFATRVMYHFHHSEALNLPRVIHDDEELAKPVEQQRAHVIAFDERMKFDGSGDVLLDGTPKISDKVGRNGVDHQRLPQSKR